VFEQLNTLNLEQSSTVVNTSVAEATVKGETFNTLLVLTKWLALIMLIVYVYYCIFILCGLQAFSCVTVRDRRVCNV